MVGLLHAGGLASLATAQQAPDRAVALERTMGSAESSLQKGDLKTAESLYREALFEGWLLEATLRYGEGRRAEARLALGEALLFRVETPDALRSLAIAQLQMGDPAAAVDILTELARQLPRNLETLRLLAKALGAAGRRDLALQRLDEATAAAGDDPEQIYVMATEYLWLKEPEAAEKLFGRLIAARPLPQTRVLIGRSYRDAGEYARAAAELRAALAQDPGTRRAHYYLGMVFLGDANSGPDANAKAIAEFQEELKLAPEDALALDQLGLALLEAGRPAEALPALEAAVRADPRWLHLYHLARVQLALDRAPEAASSSRRALELASEQGTALDLEKIHYQLGLALRKLGATAEAATQFSEARRVAAQGTKTSPAGTTAADAAAGPNHEVTPPSPLPEPVRQVLERRVKEGLARASFNLGVLQIQGPGAGATAERFARAAAFFERAAAIDPDFPQVEPSLGVAYFNARQFDKAAAPLARALAKDPENAGLKRMLATSYLNAEAWGKAADLLEKDPERPTDASLQMAYGVALLRDHRAAEAEKVLGGLLARQGDTAELLVLVGEALAEQKKYEPAIASLERALQLSPGDPSVHDQLGRAYEKLGRIELAKQHFEASRRLRTGP